MNATTCPSCGARLAPGAERCDLCGTRPDEAQGSHDDASLVSAEVPSDAPPEVGGTERVFCSSCGAPSQARARYCWQCGTALTGAESAEGVPVAAEASPSAVAPVRPPVREASAEATAPRAADPAGKRALLLLGGAMLLVVVLFALTQWGGQASGLVSPTEVTPTGGSTPPAATAASIPPEVADQAATLEDRIAQADSPEERMALRQQLVHLLANAGAFLQAASVQEGIAREEDTAPAWADTGSLLLAHVLRSEGGFERAQVSMQAASAFETALERNPGDLDVKTELATAYLYNPENPMRAVEVIREVLEEEPDHTRARFNYGLMLMQIGRTDQAREQFERVVAVAPPDDIVHIRAREELDRLDGTS